MLAAARGEDEVPALGSERLGSGPSDTARPAADHCGAAPIALRHGTAPSGVGAAEPVGVDAAIGLGIVLDIPFDGVVALGIVEILARGIGTLGLADPGIVLEVLILLQACN